MKLGPIEIFPKERPELGDCWALYWYLPFTGTHLFYMREKGKGAFRIGYLILWLLTPFIIKIFPVVGLRTWIYAGIIIPVLWIYDAITLRKLFEARWGKKLSLRI